MASNYSMVLDIAAIVAEHLNLQKRRRDSIPDFGFVGNQFSIIIVAAIAHQMD